MLKNLFKISIRNILKDKVYSSINILGLTIGITCSMFLLLYILDELSYDKYHENADNIYRIVSNIKEPDNAFTWAVAQIPLGDEIQDNYPEVQNVVRFYDTGRQLFKNGEKQFYEEDFYLVDSTVFDMFTYRFIEGDPNTALDNPNSMVLTKKIATKYFGTDSPIGQSLEDTDGEVFKITGVIENVPSNSHFIFDALISKNSSPEYRGSWGNFGVYTYVQLPPGYNLSKMYDSFDKILKERVDPIFSPVGISIKYELQKITDIHLHSKIQDEAEAGGDINTIYIFSAVAAFMLIIACINYMNLATARSANRAREVGIRKVMGSQRRQLMIQFITESVVISLIALTLSIVLIYALLPLFNSLAGKTLPFSTIAQPEVLLSLLGIVLFTGILGGSYPAFYLSGFNPVNVLKGTVASKGGSAVLRKGLVVLQFAISIFMLISTLIVFDQLAFLRNKDLGFQKEQVIRIPLSSPELRRTSEAFINKLRQNPLVEEVGTAGASPGHGIGKLLLQVEDNEGKMVDRGVDLFAADYDFVNTLKMEIVGGRNFSRDFVSDTSAAVLVNESMVKRMSWDNPIGKKFSQVGRDTIPAFRQVVGVIKDYNQNSLYNEIEPLMIFLNKSNNRIIFVRTTAGDARKTIASIEAEWNEINPNFPFEYTFLDEDFDSQYKADETKSKLFTVFSMLTIAIACLGLLALASFTTEQRTKEIGIRKVIGASVNSLVVLVSREFIVLVLIGMIIAMPVAWYFTDNWLQNFAYRIQLNNEWATFILSAVLAMVITMITVGYHVLKAAASNPVKALRDQ